ncbi:caspase, EACC1-associated type [Herbidospora sp. RD11066]
MAGVEPGRSMLAVPGARVLIVGSGSYAAESTLTTVPAVPDTVADLGRCLVERSGLDPSSLTTLVDPRDPREFARALARTAGEASDVLVVYYVGHGLVSPRNELHLATYSTIDLTEGVPAYEALPYAVMREVLTDCRAPLVLVVLDCCFSGRAQGIGRGDVDEVFETTRRSGTYVLTSTSGDEVAWAPPGRRYTAFSGALIELLTAGDATAPRSLTLDDVYRSLSRTLVAAGLPEPRRQATDHGDPKVLAPNPAHFGVPGSPGERPGEFSPYRGLNSFGAADADFFFGRSELTLSLLDRVAGQFTQPGPLVVTGPSGAGKSSLLHAGLVPALEGSSRADGRATDFVVLTPGADPMGTLAERFAPADGSHPTDLRARLLADPGHFRTLVRIASADPARRAVLIVDQFEEVFTLCPDEQHRRAFVQALSAVCADPVKDASAVVVIGVRSDFFGHCAAHPELVAALGRPVVVSPMTPAQLREVIEGPARLSDLTLQDGLVNLVLDDLGTSAELGAIGAGRVLPLLSHALLSTWQHREDRTLTLAGYRATGGIRRSLAQTADETLMRLDLGDHETARRLLVRLVRLGEGTEDTRRKVPVAELLPSAASGRVDDARHILDRFVRARLLTVDDDGVEITHEALIRAWPRFRAWIEADRTALVVRQQLSEDAAKWQNRMRDPAYLYTDHRVADARASVADPATELSVLESEFLTEGARRARRRTRITYQVIAALAALLVLATSALVYGTTKNVEAVEQRDDGISRRVAETASRIKDPLLAAQLAVAAHKIAQTPEARSALLRTLTHPMGTAVSGHTHAVDTIAFGPDRRTMATLSTGDGTVRLWDTGGAAGPVTVKVLGGEEQPISGMALSADRPLMATWTGRAVELWDVTDPARPVPVRTTAFDEDVYDVALSADGRRLAIAMAPEELDQPIQVFDIENPAKPVAGTTLTLVYAVRSNGVTRQSRWSHLLLSPDGSMLIGQAATQIQMWNITDVMAPAWFPAIPGEAAALAFSPDGSALAISRGNGSVEFWDVDGENPVLRARDKIGSVAVNHLAFNSAGTRVASASEDGEVRLWTGVRTRFPVSDYRFRTGGDALTALNFSADGDSLVTGSLLGTLRQWHLAGVARPPAHTVEGAKPTGDMDTNTIGIAFSPRQPVLATTSDGVRLWETRGSKLVPYGPLPQAPDDPNLVLVFSADGKTLAALSEPDAKAWLWDVTDPKRPDRPRIFGLDLPEEERGTTMILLSPDGRTLASWLEGEDTTQLWDVTGPSGRAVKRGSPLEYGTGSGGLHTFSADGRVLAAGGGSSDILLWDVVKGGAPGIIRVRVNTKDAIFSPDGRILAVALENQTLQFWQITDRLRPALMATVDVEVSDPGTRYIWSRWAFSPDGRTLAVAASDDTIRLLEISDTAIPIDAGALIGHTGGLFGVAFSQDGRTLVSSALDGTVRLWDLDITRAAERVCETMGNQITKGQWELFVPLIPYEPPCSAT